MKKRLLIFLVILAAVFGGLFVSPALASSHVGLDYAWHGDIHPQVFLDSGYSFVAHYLSGGNSKDLTLGESNLLSAAGVQIVVCWETTSTRALAGYAAGYSDAGRAYADRAFDISLVADRFIDVFSRALAPRAAN